MLRRPPNTTLFPYTTLSDLHNRNRETNQDPRRSRCEEHRRTAHAVPKSVTAVTQHCCDRNQRLPLELCLDSRDRKSTRLNSSHVEISYAVFCLKKKIVYESK